MFRLSLDGRSRRSARRQRGWRARSIC